MTTMDYKAVLVREPSIDAVRSILEERARTGVDRYDEVWEGVLHLVPPPSDDHGTFLLKIAFFLQPECERREGRLVDGPGLRAPGSGTSNFRVPDIVYLAPEDEEEVRSGWIEGGVAVAIEVRSPGDETYAKMPFYAARGVRELLVIDRDTRKVEVFRLRGAVYVESTPDADGWLRVDALDVRLRVQEKTGRPVLVGLRAHDREPVRIY